MRVATWNIQHGHPAAAELAGAVAALDGDVVALQEVERWTPRVGRADLLAPVLTATGMALVDGAVVAHRGGTYGNALLVRGEPTAVATRSLYRPRRRWWSWRRIEPRGAVRCRVGELTVATCHLSVEGRPIARRQLAEVLGWLDDAPPPVVLLGDLNLREPEVPDGWVQVDVPPGFPSHAPRITIDHVLLRGCTGRALPHAERPAVSDHRPIVVDLDC